MTMRLTFGHRGEMAASPRCHLRGAGMSRRDLLRSQAIYMV
jgi:hypothetical protein